MYVWTDRFSTHDEAIACSNYISETKLDNRVVRCEMDGGFKEGRQFGRGLSGGQVRDDRRSKDEYDPGRGGYGRSDVADGNHFRRTAAPRKRSRADSITGDEPALKHTSERRSPAPMDQQVRAHSCPCEPLLSSVRTHSLTSDQQEEENPRFRDRDADENANDDDDAPLDATEETTALE